MLDATKLWTRGTLLKESARLLSEAGVEGARRNVEWMMVEVLGCGRALLYAYPDQSVSPEAVATLAGQLRRRIHREPLQYILGYTDFYGLRMVVTPAVLIPRPETEQVVETALSLLADRPTPRILDVGTGSGCIALALCKKRPDAAVYACDVSIDALAVATANARALDLPVTFMHADMLAEAFPQQVPSGLDLLISNPPYIARQEAASLSPEVRDHEPHGALFSGDDPLRFYRVLVRWARMLLKPTGLLVMETHADHGASVCALATQAGLRDARLMNDLAGLPRIVTAVCP